MTEGKYLEVWTQNSPPRPMRCSSAGKVRFRFFPKNSCTPCELLIITNDMQSLQVLQVWGCAAKLSLFIFCHPLHDHHASCYTAGAAEQRGLPFPPAGLSTFLLKEDNGRGEMYMIIQVDTGGFRQVSKVLLTWTTDPPLSLTSCANTGLGTLAG